MMKRVFAIAVVGAALVVCTATNPAAAQEEWLKVVASGPHLKDWRFSLCDHRRCHAKVVLCAPGYHIIYGNRCVLNIHTPPSWEDQVRPIVPPCDGCGATHPSLYSLYNSAWPQR
jgi:hypothetical protein